MEGGVTYWGLRHEDRVEAWLRLDVLPIGVVQDGLEAFPVLDWGHGDGERGHREGTWRGGGDPNPVVALKGTPGLGGGIE